MHHVRAATHGLGMWALIALGAVVAYALYRQPQGTLAPATQKVGIGGGFAT